MYASIRGLFFELVRNTHVMCAIISVFLWNTCRRHGRSRVYCSMHNVLDMSATWQFLQNCNIKTVFSYSIWATKFELQNCELSNADKYRSYTVATCKVHHHTCTYNAFQPGLKTLLYVNPKMHMIKPLLTVLSPKLSSDIVKYVFKWTLYVRGLECVSLKYNLLTVNSETKCKIMS